MSYKDILQTIPTIQSASLLDYNLGFYKKKKKKAKNFITTGTTNIFGSAMIDAEGDFLA